MINKSAMLQLHPCYVVKLSANKGPIYRNFSDVATSATRREIPPPVDAAPRRRLEILKALAPRLACLLKISALQPREL